MKLKKARKPTKKQIDKWKVIRKEWVKALRSGDYEQGEGQLVRDGKYCCLGVLCEIIGMKQSKHIIDGHKDFIYYGTEYQLAPPKAMHAVGLNDHHGSFSSSSDSIALTEANDAGESFEFIANIIEEKPEGLFKESGYEKAN